MNRVCQLAALFALVGLSVGCPDPNPVGSYEDLSQAGPGTAPAAAGGNSAPMVEDVGATQPNEARFRVKPGEGIEVSGTFVYEGEISGMRRLDFRAIPEGEGAPRLVHTLEVRSGDTWEIEAPKGFGQLQVHAFIDQDGDGPTKGDPGYVTDPPLRIDQEPILLVELRLTDDFDPSVLAPGGAPGAMRAVQGDPAGAPGGADGGQDPSGPAPGSGMPTPDGPPPDNDMPTPDGPPPDNDMPTPDGPPPDADGG